MAVVLASTTKKAAKSTVLPTRDPMTHPLLHGISLPPRLNPTSCMERAVTNNKEPVKSTFALICPHVGFTTQGFLMTSHPTKSARAEMGT
ncbi:hypothetical protein Tdes44962_MAKER04645 [Teratosphaeria destructans]|uniref:Uncharacterized protein n=1 Tax=Teratosphaeria destructans TaxID=418781 RepID=A0A9W7SLL5_9PEZI|nr:hypothetical protein Tdes44962_MAKER04645 [Teratosphaeria destructans]